MTPDEPDRRGAAALGLPEGLVPERTAFFLDFDGTLVEIAARPEDVVVAPRTRAVLARLSAATNGALAIISGRELADIDRFLAPLRLAAAGSHGAELRAAPGAAAEEAEGHAVLHRAAEDLAAFAGRHGLLLEHKRGALSLHYRSHPEHGDAARALVARIAAGTPELRTIDGNMVAELALAGFDKGRAVERLLETPRFAGRMPVVAGDDTTDEDAFVAALRRGGVAIKVGAGRTAAGHRARDTAAFLDWLEATAGAMEAMRGARA